MQPIGTQVAAPAIAEITQEEAKGISSAFIKAYYQGLYAERCKFFREDARYAQHNGQVFSGLKDVETAFVSVGDIDKIVIKSDNRIVTTANEILLQCGGVYCMDNNEYPFTESFVLSNVGENRYAITTAVFKWNGECPAGFQFKNEVALPAKVANETAKQNGKKIEAVKTKQSQASPAVVKTNEHQSGGSNSVVKTNERQSGGSNSVVKTNERQSGGSNSVGKTNERQSGGSNSVVKTNIEYEENDVIDKIFGQDYDTRMGQKRAYHNVDLRNCCYKGSISVSDARGRGNIGNRHQHDDVMDIRASNERLPSIERGAGKIVFRVDFWDAEKITLSEELSLNLNDTVSTLQEELLKRFNIDPMYQKIVKNDEQIISSRKTLSAYGFGDDDVVSLQHIRLPNWKVYQNLVDSVRLHRGNRILDAKRAVDLHTEFMISRFFDAYPEYDRFRAKYHEMVVSWSDGNLGLMKDACISHFRAQHFHRGARDESTYSCKFETRPDELGGSRKNTIAVVQMFGETRPTKYNVKCHNFGSSIQSSAGGPPDIKEVFVYKLLQLINVGPEVEFILPNKLTGTKTSLYIATKWMEQFVSLKPESETVEKHVDVEVLVQLSLLSSFLFISDLHKNNCGFWSNRNNAAIVDFCPGPARDCKDVMRLLISDRLSILWESYQCDSLVNCSQDNWIKIAKKYFEKWNLLSAIDTADEKIKLQKDKMKELAISFRGYASPTEELEIYITTVKKNLTKLQAILDQDSQNVDQRF